MDAIRASWLSMRPTNHRCFKAARMHNYEHLLDETILWGRSRNHLTSEITAGLP